MSLTIELIKRTKKSGSVTASVTALLLALAGCASLPPPPSSAPVRDIGGVASPKNAHVLNQAKRFVGTPYSFGGESPHGFDCSGLVFFAYQQLGIDVPRTAVDQYRHARPFRLDRLSPGDLVFFRLDRKKVSHVGIYAGDSRFIHAPRAGSKVTYDRLDSPFWSRRFIGAGRFL